MYLKVSFRKSAAIPFGKKPEPAFSAILHDMFENLSQRFSAWR
jgi:hypothetical protein